MQKFCSFVLNKGAIADTIKIITGMPVVTIKHAAAAAAAASAIASTLTSRRTLRRVTLMPVRHAQATWMGKGAMRRERARPERSTVRTKSLLCNGEPTESQAQL